MEKKKPQKTNIKKKESSKRDQLALDVYDSGGKVVGFENLPKEIFSIAAPKTLIAQAIRVYLTRRRKGTASTKTRGEVRGGGRKPWRQKGTGRARAGSIRDPQWRGGGVVFGPTPRDFSLSLPKKMRRQVLFGVLSDKLKEKKIFCVKGLSKLEGKTKQFLGLLLKLPITDGRSKKILLVLAKKDEQAVRLVRNLKNLSVATVNNLNLYQILDNDFLLLEKEAVVSFEELFLKKKEPESLTVSKAVKNKNK